MRIVDDMERKSTLSKGSEWDMERDAIIFFDKLGFGWVLDRSMVKEMKLHQLKDDRIVNTSLMRILENILDYPLL
jgi:hypothetical protein